MPRDNDAPESVWRPVLLFLGLIVILLLVALGFTAIKFYGL